MNVELVKLDADYFSHLPEHEIGLMGDLESQKRSFCFKVSANKTYYVFLDLDDESIHVRHIGGAFAFEWKYILFLCEAVAKESGHEKISVIADKDFMIFAVKRLGFKETSTNFWERAI